MHRVSRHMSSGEWAMLLALSLLWGGSFFFYKVLGWSLPPLTIVLARMGLSALVLNLWLIARRDPMPLSPRLWGGFVVLGLLNGAVPFTLFAFGETRIASGLAAILNATTPLFTALVAHSVTREDKLTAAKLAGIIIGFTGVAVVVGPGAMTGMGGGAIWGVLACLGAAVSYAFGVPFGRRFGALSTIKVATGQMTGGTIVLLPLAAVIDRPWTLPAPDAGAWAALLGMALISTVAAYLLFFRILASAGPGNVVLVTFLVPVSALLLGWAFLGETLAPRAFGGVALIALGLACVDGRLLSLARSRRASRVYADAPPGCSRTR